YSELISYVLNADIKSLTDTAKSVDAMSDSKAIAFIGEFLPFLLKLTLALLPVMMATWFSPMLIVFNNYRVLKAVKSSIAGSLQYMIALSITWIILTLSIFAILLFSGVVIALIGSFAPLFGQLLMPLVLFGSLLVATALMFAFQYVSYRDVFRSA
ncbi:MAG: hypothetical protein ABL859_03605, partial [Methylotenera sp.]